MEPATKRTDEGSGTAAMVLSLKATSAKPVSVPPWLLEILNLMNRAVTGEVNVNCSGPAGDVEILAKDVGAPAIAEKFVPSVEAVMVKSLIPLEPSASISPSFAFQKEKPTTSKVDPKLNVTVPVVVFELARQELLGSTAS